MNPLLSIGDVLENLPGDIKVKAYGSTDAGVSFLVTTSGGRKIFHAGDLNDWHWQDDSSRKRHWTAHIPFCDFGQGQIYICCNGHGDDDLQRTPPACIVYFRMQI